MAIAVTNRATSGSAADATSYTTDSFTPSAGALLIACFSVDRSSAPPQPTCADTGAGLTWTRFADYNWSVSSGLRNRITLFAAQAGVSPAAMAVTATYGNMQSGCNWSVFEISGSDVGNSGIPGVIVQTAQAAADVSGTAVSGVTLAAAGSADNRAFIFVDHAANESLTQESGWSEIGTAQHASPSLGAMAGWNPTAFDASPTPSWTTSAKYGAVAFEIKAAMPGTTTTFQIDKGNFAFSGNPIGIVRQRRFAIDTGNFAFAGGNVGFTRVRRFSIATGNFAYTAQVWNITRQIVTFGILVSPHGIFGGAPDGLTNPKTQGAYKKYYFRDFQPTSDTAFSWGNLDNQLTTAAANGKQFSLLLNLNSGDPQGGLTALPAWLAQKGAVVYQAYNGNHGAYVYSYLGWEPVFQSYALKLIAAIGDRYDGQLASVSMGGMGLTTEMGVTVPSPDGKSTDEAIAAWIDACKIFIAQYAAHFKRTAFVGALATSGITADALNTVVDWAVANYGSHVGFENWALNAHSTTQFLPNLIISNHRLTNPVGFQMIGSTGGGGGDLGGTLRDAMEAGVALGAQYLQVFGSDTAQSAFGPDFDAVAAELLPPPSGGKVLGITTANFAFAGNPIGFVRVRHFAIAPGSFAFAGSPITFQRGRRFTIATGNFSFTGNAIGFSVTRRFSFGTANFPFVGNSINFNGRRSFNILPANFAFTGNDIGIRTNRRFVIETANFPFAGSDIEITTEHIPTETRFSIETGNFAFTGNTIGITPVTTEVEIIQPSLPFDGAGFEPGSKLYVTVQGDMWDLIALRVYGMQRGADHHLDILLAANPTLANYNQLPGGLYVKVPPLPVVTEIPLVPWKKATVTAASS